ncbi:fdxr [Symbiodinium microadriaticum]|nr:fdxr [Symbiodinium microadriaticum]
MVSPISVFLSLPVPPESFPYLTWQKKGYGKHATMPEEAKKEAESKDVEMKDAKEDEKKEPEKPKDPRTLLLEALSQNLKTIAAAGRSGVSAGDPRVMGRVLRSLASLRRKMEPEVLKALLEEFVDASRPSKIVGSGPAGFYTSKYLFKKKADGPLQIDMRSPQFERLPTPFGLVRFGVAPDHPEVKNVINDFTDVAQTPNFRFFGNVEVGKGSLSLEAMRKMYDAVVLCTGASGERRLGIPGEDCEGVVGAPAFVKWYNGHPDYQNLKVPAAGEAAVVVGQGNVALDVARLLVRSPKELHATDMEAAAVEQIAAWQAAGLRSVHIVGGFYRTYTVFTLKLPRRMVQAAMLATDASTQLPKAQALMSQMQANSMELKSEIKRFKTLNAVLQRAIDSQLQKLPELQFAGSTAAPATRLAQACGALKTRAQELEHQIAEKRQRKLQMQRELEERKAKLKPISLSTTPAKLNGSPLKLSPSSGTGSGISNISRKEAALLLQQDLFRKRFLLRTDSCAGIISKTAAAELKEVLPIIDPEELQRLGSWARVLQRKR